MALTRWSSREMRKPLRGKDTRSVWLESIVQKLGRYSDSSKTAPSICHTKFQTILDLSALPTYSKSSAINRVVLRDLLLDPVIAEGRVTFDKHFSHYEIIENGSSGNESVEVNFTDGSSEYCDILVAAHGSGSKASESCLIPISFHRNITDTEFSMQINKQIGAKNLVDMKSHVSFLSKGNATKERLRQLPPRLLNGPILVFKNGISLYYARRIPLTLILYHFPIDIVQFTCPPPNRKAGIKIKMTISTLTRTKHHSTRAFCDWSPEYHVMLSAGASDEDNITVTRLRASTKLSKDWRQRLQAHNGNVREEGHPRVWLVGDAVHAMQPTRQVGIRGMGGNQAMRDIADMLPQLLELKRAAEAGPPLSTREIETRCNAYEKKMIDRSFAWVAKSGGTSQPIEELESADFLKTIDLDGLLGRVISFLAGLLLPVATLLYKTAKRSKQ
ncbi:hypothetical protein FOYG_02223 [Fusarium oxysporum NRRL 32931]|uniref:FAD-binding domain-containing protein n=1 Tax=Fusarium oxysporum NRRL 32931 TaxID=660029 RepID=W9IVN0_FUSOX|nr:hypothetical protein FOYG_02223 [Fusarium oxysporum NRRL 32931]